MEEIMEQTDIYGAKKEEDNMKDLSWQYFWLLMVTI